MKRAFKQWAYWAVVLIIGFSLSWGVREVQDSRGLLLIAAGDTLVKCTSSNPNCNTSEDTEKDKKTDSASPATDKDSEQTKQSSSCIIQMLLGRSKML